MITYLILDPYEIDKLEKNNKIWIQNVFLKKYIRNLSKYKYIVVYKRDQKISFYGVFEVQTHGGKLFKKRNKIKRPVDNIHKFWARKPWWAVSQYILNYSNEEDVVFDPMCGSGIIGYEALRLGRRVILADRNPFAIFLARNTIRPINLSSLLNYYEEVLNRRLDRDIVTTKGKIIIPKGTRVEDAIRRLYETKCQKSKKTCEVRYYVWDTVYEFTGKMPKEKKGKILIDAIQRIKGISTPPSTISHCWLAENWEKILKKASSLWKNKYPKEENPFDVPRPRPSTITQLFGNLVREGCYRRIRREPKLAYYICPNSKNKKGTFKQLDDDDERWIELLEEVVIPYSYPTTRLSYPNGKLFDTARPDSLFVPHERLSTWTHIELQNQDEKVHHLFTKRNLLALSILFWSISQVSDVNIREILYLAFTETLPKASKLISSKVASMNGKRTILGGHTWTINRFSVPPDYAEYNVLYVFKKSFFKVYDAKEQSNMEILNYKEAMNNPDEFIKNSSIKALYLIIDSKKIHIIFQKYKDLVDMVFTDPPYGDAIQYYELCTFWTSWLLLDADWRKTYGDGDWWKEELIVNQVRKKSLADFARELKLLFSSVAHIVKEDGWWVITYHKREPKYWNALTESLLSIGLSLYDEERHELLGKSFNPNKDFRFLSGDAYTLWKKQPSGPKIKNIQKVAEEFFRLIEPFIVKYNGVLPRKVIESVYVQMSWKTDKKVYSTFFENKLDIFLQKHFILIKSKNIIYCVPKRETSLPGVSTEYWRRLWDKAYKKVELNKFLEQLLFRYIKSKNDVGERVQLDDIYRDLINRVNGRVSKDIVMNILRKIAKYDWIYGGYITGEDTAYSIMPYIHIESPGISLDPPEKLIQNLIRRLLQIAPNLDIKIYVSKEYELPRDQLPRVQILCKRYLIKRESGDFSMFPVVIQKNNIRVCIDINRLQLASNILISRKNAKVLILYGSKTLENDFREHYEEYIKQGRLVTIYVLEKKTEDIVKEVLSYIKKMLG